MVAELSLRLVGLGHPYQSEAAAYQQAADSELLFTLRPGFSGFSDGTRVSLSSQGLRDREFEQGRQPDTFRILALGDSVTFGPGVLSEETFVKRLEARLNETSGGSQHEVINAGVTGYNTIQERVRLEQIGPQFHPDLVLLTFVVNDLLDSFSVLDRQYEPGGILAPLKKWLRRNSHLYRFSQNTFWRLAAELRKDPDQPEPTRNRSRLVEREREIGRIAEISRERGAAFLLALYPDNLHQLVTADSAGRQVSVREHLMDFGAQMEIPVVDLTDALGDVRDQRARTMRLREDPHPSPAGHRAIAEALLEALRSQGLVGG